MTIRWACATARISRSLPWCVAGLHHGDRTQGSGALTFPVDVAPASQAWSIAAPPGPRPWPSGARSRSSGGAGSRSPRWACSSWRRRRGRMPPWCDRAAVRWATLTTAPDRVQLWFNEAIEPKFSRVSVWDSAGQQVDLADARVEPDDPKRLTVGLSPETAPTACAFASSRSTATSWRASSPSRSDKADRPGESSRAARASSQSTSRTS